MNGITRSDHPLIGICYWILRKIFGPVVRLLLIRRVGGLANIPKSGSAILAFNHQSFFDFICVPAIAPRNIHFLAAEKFFEHRWWRKLMVVTGQIRVDRHVSDKSSVYEIVESHVRNGTLIGIFPEGTRSPHHDSMLKAFGGVAQFALKHNIPIIPVGILGTYEIMSVHDTRPHIKKIVDIKIGEPLIFSEHKGMHSDKNICSLVTHTVMKELEKLSGKKYPHDESSI